MMATSNTKPSESGKGSTSKIGARNGSAWKSDSRVSWSEIANANSQPSVGAGGCDRERESDGDGAWERANGSGCACHAMSLGIIKACLKSLNGRKNAIRTVDRMGWKRHRFAPAASQDIATPFESVKLSASAFSILASRGKTGIRTLQRAPQIGK